MYGRFVGSLKLILILYNDSFFLLYLFGLVINGFYNNNQSTLYARRLSNFRLMIVAYQRNLCTPPAHLTIISVDKSDAICFRIIFSLKVLTSLYAYRNIHDFLGWVIKSLILMFIIFTLCSHSYPACNWFIIQCFRWIQKSSIFFGTLVCLNLYKRKEFEMNHFYHSLKRCLQLTMNCKFTLSACYVIFSSTYAKRFMA